MTQNHFTKTIKLVAIIGIACLVFACESEPPPQPSQPQPSVVSGSIPTMKPAQAISVQSKQIQSANGEKTKGLPAPKATQPIGNSTVNNKTQPLPHVSKNNKAQPIKPKTSKDLPATQEKEKGSTALAKKAIKIEKEDEHYDFEGKIDPFQPLVSDKAEEEETIDEEMPKRILTPLEKIDLSAIKLVAVVRTDAKNIAMVEEASGKGYIVKLGTYMGRNHGRVSEIKSNSIMVRELIKNYKGKYIEQFQEIKLLKKDGEE